MNRISSLQFKSLINSICNIENA